MSDDNYDKESFDDMRREIRAGGARDAIDALRQVCRDPKSSSQARATAGSTLLRAAGLLDKAEDPDVEKPLSEMTPEELDRAVRRALVNQEVRARERVARAVGPGNDDQSENSGTVFDQCAVIVGFVG